MIRVPGIAAGNYMELVKDILVLDLVDLYDLTNYK